MAKPKGTHHVVTASFTETGGPAYLTSDGSWSPNLQDALAIESDEQCAERLAHAQTQQRLVSDPYSIRVEQRNTVLDPLSQKESIRATGPSVRWSREAGFQASAS